MSAAPGALGDLRVVDCSRLIAGGVLATMLADLGADVVKIENPKAGDPLRTWSKSLGELWWKVYARGKRSITLNLTKAEGQALLKRLARNADVLIENYVPGTFETWGLGWEALSKENPRLVMVRVSGWGQDGPYRDRPGFGTMVEAMSGFAATTGPAESPTLPSFPMADMVAAQAGAVAVLAALRHRDRVSGRGQVIDVPLYEPLLSILGPNPIEYRAHGIVRERIGNRSHNASPRGTYRTNDGKWVALSASTPASADAMFKALGIGGLLADPRFATNDARIANGEAVDQAIAEAIGQRSREEIVRLFETEGLTAAPVYDIADIMEDPHFKARHTFVDLPDPELGTATMSAPTPRLSDTPGTIRWVGPPLGAHNREVYAGELGLSDAEMERLKADGVI
jgi:crotonobetainyl-CoA:carnitine CoA-transferase CaiB-like acyl-CoA transferase